MSRVSVLTMLLVTMLAAPAAAQSPDVIDEVSVVIVQLRDPDGGALTLDQLDATRAVIEARLAHLPAAGAAVTPIPGDRIRIDLTDPSWLEAVTRVATAPGIFRIVGIPPDRAGEVETGAELPADMEVEEIVTSGLIADAALGDDELGMPAVDLELDAQASEAFDAWATDHFGQTVALILDDVVASAATLQATDYDGRIQISGSFGRSQAEELVAILGGGELSVQSQSLPDCLPAACAVPSPSPGASTAP